MKSKEIDNPKTLIVFGFLFLCFPLFSYSVFYKKTPCGCQNHHDIPASYVPETMSYNSHTGAFYNKSTRRVLFLDV